MLSVIFRSSCFLFPAARLSHHLIPLFNQLFSLISSWSPSSYHQKTLIPLATYFYKHTLHKNIHNHHHYRHHQTTNLNVYQTDILIHTNITRLDTKVQGPDYRNENFSYKVSTNLLGTYSSSTYFYPHTIILCSHNPPSPLQRTIINRKGHRHHNFMD